MQGNPITAMMGSIHIRILSAVSGDLAEYYPLSEFMSADILPTLIGMALKL